MFANLDRVTYQVPDIEKARDWYSRILNKEPVIDSPFITVFKISDFLLILVPEPDSSPGGGQPPVAYWGVDDIHTAYQRLLEFGAAAHTEISINVFNSRVAKVVDPFGNIIGITGKASDTDKSLEDQPSDTALTTAFCRALAACERRDEVKGPDYLAEIFIDEEGKKTLRDPAAREWVMKNLMKGGVYEYFIARTAYIDHIVKQAFQENIPQVVFLGAGYDGKEIPHPSQR
ncbi:MAG TPA: class I SAM-dependent methyltransferase [Bacillota bacterium]|nr:class I SAM-dependent methyltransferase [Bacillota bacterium]